MPRARRSCLAVPGSSERMLAKAQHLDADEIVIDLEDAVTADRKDEARAATAAAIRDGDWGERSIAVRINAPATEWGERDVVELAENAGDRLGCLVVPKVEGSADLAVVGSLLGEHDVGLHALIETAAGLAGVREIAASCHRLEALLIGYADLAASLGRPPAADYPGDRWHWVRETVLVAARSAGIQAIDGPHLEIDDLEGLRVEAERTRALGFDGKWAVHPSQLDTINEVFSPRQEEVDRAGAVLAALEAAERDGGRGAVRLDGEMLDEAHRKLALQVVARGEAAGMSPRP
jgi:citrate lyase subunit beta / citryl-CoA lyase